LHLLDVRTSGKGLFRAGDDDAANLLVTLEAIQRLVDLADELAVQRVQRLRTMMTPTAPFVSTRMVS
jgi:hypothetical protein